MDDWLLHEGDPVAYLRGILARPAWHDDAACRDNPAVTVEDFYPPRGRTGDTARAVCEGCLVRAECLSYALAGETVSDLGIWGGTTVQLRRQMRRSVA